MPPKSKAKRAQATKRDFPNLLFFCLYIVLNFFIAIGEFTQKVFISPYKFTKWSLGKVTFLRPKRGRGRPKKRDLTAPFRKANKIFTPIFIKAVRAFLTIIVRTGQIVGKTLLRFIVSISRAFSRVIRTIVRFILSFFTIRLRFFLLGFLVCFLVFSAIQVKTFVAALPSPRQIGSINYPLSTHIYDRNGRLLYEVYRDQNRTPIKLADLPPYVTKATIAFEDKDFYRHNGVSLYSGVLRALKENLLNKHLQGGSTITQQLVKSALLTPERSFQRKIKEIVLALWAERIYSKDQILEMYLNQVPYGGSSYGIEEASKTYLGKSARDLSLSEAALLAGLPQAPSIYSPFIDPQLAVSRRNQVLLDMEHQKYITHDQRMKAESEKLAIIPPRTLIKAPHFVFHVKSDLEQEFGTREIEEGGLKVTSTIDLDLQLEAEKILKEELAKVQNLQVSNGAILITRPSTGEILAMVGSADYFAAPSGAFNDTTALRQPGSSIKPLMYSLALEKNYTAATSIDDSPAVFRISDTEVYKPVNYDGKFHGRVPLRYALANSYNIPAVKVLNSIGVDQFVDHAKKMGITTWGDSSQYGLSLTLGGGEVKMTDMATAFGVFANAGYKVPVKDIIKLEDSKNEEVSMKPVEKTKVLDDGIAYIISDILSDNVARQQAFGPGNQLEISGHKVAVKTGTTDSKKDNWTIGYTPDFLVAVWVGNNDGTPMNPFLTSGVTGAAPIWHRVMEYVLNNYNKDGNNWFTKPSDIVEKSCYGGRVEYFLTGTENNAGCSSYGKPTPVPQKEQPTAQPTTPIIRENFYNRGRGKNKN